MRHSRLTFDPSEVHEGHAPPALQDLWQGIFLQDSGCAHPHDLGRSSSSFQEVPFNDLFWRSGG